MRTRILVPVDFSDPALHALEGAIQLARQLRAELIVLHVVEPVYYAMAGDVPGLDAGLLYRELERSGREQLGRLAAKLRARRVPARTALAIGTAAERITESAKKLKVDFIVMSTHGRTGLSHFLMGSVAERVVRTAACPVMTIRPPAPVARRRTRRPVRPGKRAAAARRR